MTIPEPERSAVLVLIEREQLTAFASQPEGDRLVSEFVERLAPYIGYRPRYIPRLGKSRDRAKERAEQLWSGSSPPTPQAVVSQLKDFAGGRLVAQRFSDVRLIHKFLIAHIETHLLWRLGGSARDRTEQPKDSGWRGLIQDTVVLLRDGKEAHYELQIMTWPQLGFDQAEHFVYERRRSGKAVPLDIEKRLLNISEVLFQVDKRLDAEELRIAFGQADALPPPIG